MFGPIKYKEENVPKDKMKVK